jgi:hypothetical protein
MENRWAGTWGILWGAGIVFLATGLTVRFTSTHPLAGWAIIAPSVLLMIIGGVGVFWSHKRALFFAVAILGLVVDPSLFLYAQLTDPISSAVVPWASSRRSSHRSAGVTLGS